MKQNKYSAMFITALIVFTVITSLGCNGTPSEGNAEDAFTQETVRDLSKITPQVINDLDYRIDNYLAIRHDPARLEESIESRKNLTVITHAYEIGLKEAMVSGDDEQKLIAAMALGFLNSQAQMKETVSILVSKVKKGNEDDELRYRALIGLMLMEKSLKLYGFDDEGNLTKERDEMLYAVAYNLSNIKMNVIRTVAAITLGFSLNIEEKPNIVDALILRLSEEIEAETKVWVIFSLAEIGSKKGLDAIAYQAMNDDDPSIRVEAVVTLGKSLKPEYIPMLLKKLDDKEAAIRMQTIMMLKGYRNIEEKREIIADAIEQLLNDTDYKVRMWATVALGDLGEKKVISRLIAKLGDRELNVQIAAVQSLGKLADERAIEPLIKAMASKNVELRQRCRLALSRITGADWGESATDWQSWFDAGMPPVSPEKKAKTNTDETS
ncbi:MAG: HEAT repeat domain-containing protein [Planctomycetes bacterium]|nr:HEAT repeat domain-containing protein [Planctomycetota bacterium]